MQNNRPTYVHGYRHRLHSVIGCASGLPHTLAGSGDGRDMNSSLSLRCLYSLVKFCHCYISQALLSMNM